MKGLLTRTLTGIVYVVVIVGSLLWSPGAFLLVFALFLAGTMWEFCQRVNQHAGTETNALITVAAALLLYAAMANDFLAIFTFPPYLPFLLTLLYIIGSELYRKSPSPLRNWAFSFAALIYIALPFSLLTRLAFVYNPMIGTVTYSYVYPLSLFILLWVSDTGAYCIGSTLGRVIPAKLFPRISPKKSWAGSIGGGLCCLAAAGMLWYFFPQEGSLWQWLGFGFVVFLFGTWGDLVESLFKRELGIKDSGHALPGHGGFLDRFDSALLAIPAATIYLYLIQNI